VLATSRAELGVPGERRWPLAPLSVAPGQATWQDVADSDAALVFAEHMRSVEPSFALTEHNAPHVQAICERLDGLPLALELAGARAPQIGLAQLATSLRDGPSLLTGAIRTRPARHHSLAASMDWSLDQLDDLDRHLLQHLAVFVDGWALDGAEAVCSDDRMPREAVLPALQRLIACSLVSFESDGRQHRAIGACWYVAPNLVERAGRQVI
jgi:non-specific serine/threonine protein kinase